MIANAALLMFPRWLAGDNKYTQEHLFFYVASQDNPVS